MIRHLVLWRLQATEEVEKAAAVASIAAALEPLIDVIPGIHSLTVSANVVASDANWDAALVGDYESLEALAAYQVHPAHVEAAAVVRTFTRDRAVADFAV
jgi:hypothetical protein